MSLRPAVGGRLGPRRASSVVPGGRVKACPARRRRRGVAAVEFALTLPLFLMLTLGIIEFGRAFSVQQMVTNAAREGARHAVLPNATSGEVTQKVRDFLAAGNINDTRVTVTLSPSDLSGARTGTTVTVSVVAPYAAVSWLSHPWFLNGVNLSSQCAMRHE